MVFAFYGEVSSQENSYLIVLRFATTEELLLQKLFQWDNFAKNIPNFSVVLIIIKTRVKTSFAII